MQKHKGLRTFIVNDFAWEDASEDNNSGDESSGDEDTRDEGPEDDYSDCLNYPRYSWLERLLSRNRNITVLNRSGKRCSNGTSTDRLYLLNHFYHRSAKLVTESPSSRPLLVATALVEGAPEEFIPTSLLLYNHTDILCELIQGLSLAEHGASHSAPEDPEDTVSLASTPPELFFTTVKECSRSI